VTKLPVNIGDSGRRMKQRNLDIKDETHNKIGMPLEHCTVIVLLVERASWNVNNFISRTHLSQLGLKF